MPQLDAVSYVAALDWIVLAAAVIALGLLLLTLRQTGPQTRPVDPTLFPPPPMP